jgi:hypothetical protein
MKIVSINIVLILVSVYTFDVMAETCMHNDAMAPVVTYTTAMKEYRFDDAYAALSEKMTDGMAVESWAQGQKKMFDLGQVVIGKVDVRWPQHLDRESCSQRALVPNVLSAKDRFNNQGSVEFELYTLSNYAGTWKIDAQETLIEDDLVHRWFPGDTIPEFKGQLLDDEPLPGDE